MGQHFLETLWPVFGFARILGMFPCKRKWNEDGTMELKPINWKVQWLVYGCTMLLVWTSTIGANIWLYLNTEKSIEEVQQCHKNMGAADSIIDLLTLLVIFLLGGLLASLIQYGNSKMRDTLCDLSFQLDFTSDHDSPKVAFFTVSVLFVPAIICNAFLSGWILVECLALDWIEVAPTFISFFLLNLVGYLPLLVFFGLTLECFSAISYTIQKLRQQLEQSKLTIETIGYVLTMNRALENVRGLLSRNIFCVMTVTSMEILVMLFFVPANFINYSSNGKLIVLVGAGDMLMFAICFCTLMWFFNIRAQKVTDLVHQTKEDLQDIYVPDQSYMVNFKGQTVPVSFMKDRIILKLNDFDGFDGKGYFVLGKSYLKNFLAFCATYFVILLQFKLSE